MVPLVQDQPLVWRQHRCLLPVVSRLSHRQIGGQQRYAAIWVENENDRGWIELRDITADTYRNYWVRNRDLGYRLVDFEVYATAGGDRYAGVWRQNSDRPDWPIRSAVDSLAQKHLDDFKVPGIGVAIAAAD